MAIFMAGGKPIVDLAPEVGLGPVGPLIRGQITTIPSQIKPIRSLIALIFTDLLLTVLLNAT